MRREPAYLYELVGVRVQLGQHGRGLVGRAVLQDALDDAAAVRVRGQRVHLPRERVDYELQRRRLHALYALLYLERDNTPLLAARPSQMHHAEPDTMTEVRSL